jgi:hypothetical protein
VLAAVGLQTGTRQPAPSITIDSAQLRLGMTRSEVLAALQPRYTINDSTIMSISGPPFHSPGSVIFSDSGRLTKVSKTWSPSDQQQAVPMAESLYGALSQITKPAAKQIGTTTVQICECTIFVYSTFSSGAEVKHIDVFDGVKTVSVSLIQGEALRAYGGPAAVVDESIGSAR